MSVINILPSSVYNKISAGEVVERPSSVVKELVENSIDAGATSIIIEVKEGGKSLISVSDNGTGMTKEDLKKAFLPHATSKLKDEKDLENINTLGFRGEALASISSVSIIDITSKTEDMDVAYKFMLASGGIVGIEEVASNTGTTIKVENLFFNTPARFKFLKKNSLEESDITNLVSRYILINHHIAFKYVVNDKVIFQSNGSSLRDSILIVYGKEFFQNIIPIKGEYKGMTVSGYAGKPTFSKSNKSYQTVSLNNRYIVNNQISIASFKAYQEYMMKRCFPFYVFNINMSNEEVDVNVHPNKMDVRFEKNDDIFRLVYGAVSSGINEYNFNEVQTISGDLTLNINNNNQIKKDEIEVNEQRISPCENINDSKDTALEKEDNSNITAEKMNNQYQSLHDSMPAFIYDVKPNMHLSDLNYRSEITPFAFSDDDIDPNIVNRIKILDEIIPTENEQVNLFNDVLIEDEALMQQYRIIGQLFNTYVLIETGDKFYMIDQHAVHERFLYDKILENVSTDKNIQDLLCSYVFTTNYSENAFILDKIDCLNNLGFGIEAFGVNTFKISSVPYYFSNENISDFVSEILQESSKLNTIKDIDVLNERLTQKACKSAIKAGKTLSDSEIKMLVQQIKEGKILQCPHGRPAIVTLSKKDIEKMFKRIV